jgi:hypothetical protein
LFGDFPAFSFVAKSNSILSFQSVWLLKKMIAGLANTRYLRQPANHRDACPTTGGNSTCIFQCVSLLEKIIAGLKQIPISLHLLG